VTIMGTETITDGKHMLLTTYRKSGAGASSPVSTVAVSDDRVGMWTGSKTAKFARVRHDSHVTIQSCSARGKTTPSSAVFEVDTDDQVRIGAAIGLAAPPSPA
jgi:PPOX class probable F420-dependent enzyme